MCKLVNWYGLYVIKGNLFSKTANLKFIIHTYGVVCNILSVILNQFCIFRL